MKKLKFTCTNCNAKLRVPTHLAGVSAPCPKCGTTITAPSDITSAVDDELEPRRAASPSAVRSLRQEAALVSSGGKRLDSVPLVPANTVMSKATTSVEVPTPISRPLQPRPMMQPVVSVETSAPVSYSPPPPVRSIVPVPPENDVRSLPPVSLPPLPPPPVEKVATLPVASPPPLIPVITQPIQTLARSPGLPQSREVSSAPGSLPRLDVSLAGQDPTAAATILFPEGGGQSVRTRVQLPQPGVETHNFSPDDFIVPTAPPVLVSVSEVTPPPVPESLSAHDEAIFSDSGSSGDGGFVPLEELPAPTQRLYTTIPLPSRYEAIPLDDLDSTSFDDLPESGDPDEAGEEDFYAVVQPGAGDALFAGDRGPDFELPQWEEDELFGGYDQNPLPETPPIRLEANAAAFPVEWPTLEALQNQARQPSVAGEAVPANFYEELPKASLHEGSFGKLFSQQPGEPGLRISLPQAAPFTQAPEEVEQDVLENLFRDRPRREGDSKGLSKTAIIMISCLAGAAIVATVVVVFVIQSFGGGLNPAESYKEGTVIGTEDTSPAAVTKTPAILKEPSLSEAPAIIDPVALIRESGATIESSGISPAVSPPPVPAAEGGKETPAISFDERVQRVVNGVEGVEPGSPVAGSTVSDPVDGAINQFSQSVEPGGITALVAPALQSSFVPEPPQPGNTAIPSAVQAAAGVPFTPEAATSPAGTAPAPKSLDSPAAKTQNYNPAPSFAAPGPDEGPLLRTNDVVDAFLRAPDSQTRARYTYRGGSLQAAIEDYYKKWPDKPIGRYSIQLFQMEQSTSLGGPYWVYLISTNDMDQGFPLIVRVEDGNLKVDWEIYSEFYDRHFVRYREGKMPSPATFRVVIERVSGYYGSDSNDFTSLKDYQVYQVNPPYGDLNEFSENVFVKKDSDLAKKLDGVVGLGDEPLAVIVTLDEKTFEHGVKHYVVTDYLTEGWFR